MNIINTGAAKKLPKMMGFQAAGAAPLVHGQPVPNPETLATAIRIGNPASWDKAVAVQEASQGAFYAVTDEEILAAYRILAREEGVFLRTGQCGFGGGVVEGGGSGASGSHRGVCADGEWFEGSDERDRPLPQLSEDQHRG